LLSFSFLLLLPPPPPRSTLFPYTTLFRSRPVSERSPRLCSLVTMPDDVSGLRFLAKERQWRLRRHWRSCASLPTVCIPKTDKLRSEEHTSELQSPCNLVCRLLLEKKKKNI